MRGIMHDIMRGDLGPAMVAQLPKGPIANIMRGHRSGNLMPRIMPDILRRDLEPELGAQLPVVWGWTAGAGAGTHISKNGRPSPNGRNCGRA